MATLTDTNHRIRFTLSLLYNSEDKEWANYTIEIFNSEENNWVLNEDLSLLNFEYLFLEIYYDTEIITFMNGLEDVINGKEQRYKFSPYDEKEFTTQFTLTNESDEFDFSYTNNCKLEELKMRISRDNILIFLSELKQEYKTIEDKLNVQLWNEKYSS